MLGHDQFRNVAGGIIGAFVVVFPVQEHDDVRVLFQGSGLAQIAEHGLFALAQFVYFTYIDKGYFMEQIAQMFTELTTAQAMQQLGMAKGLAQTIADLSQMRPIDLVLNIMTSNLLIGLVIGLPIGIMAHRSSKPLPPASPQKERPQQ